MTDLEITDCVKDWCHNHVLCTNYQITVKEWGPSKKVFIKLEGNCVLSLSRLKKLEERFSSGKIDDIYIRTILCPTLGGPLFITLITFELG